MFGYSHLADGLSFVALAIGLFGFGEIAANLERPTDRSLLTSSIGGLWPSATERRRALPAIARGTLLGSMIGVLPGGGSTLSSFASYALEKRISKNPSEFGNGAVEGLAGPESANNAAAQTSFVPLLTLGIPSNPMMALMMGALMIQGIAPGPGVITNQPTLFWGLIASMWIGNVMLLIINLPLVGLWVKLLRVPYRLLFPSIIVFSSIGIYGINNSSFDIIVAAAFAVVGYVFYKIDLEAAPFLLGFVLGPLVEENLRRSLIMSRGSFSIFLERPICLALVALSISLFALVLFPKVKSQMSD